MADSLAQTLPVFSIDKVLPLQQERCRSHLGNLEQVPGMAFLTGNAFDTSPGLPPFGCMGMPDQVLFHSSTYICRWRACSLAKDVTLLNYSGLALQFVLGLKSWHYLSMTSVGLHTLPLLQSTSGCSGVTEFQSLKPYMRSVSNSRPWQQHSTTFAGAWTLLRSVHPELMTGLCSSIVQVGTLRPACADHGAVSANSRT